MDPKFENRGGLIGQLRGLALEGSDENLWNQPVAQKSIYSHMVSLNGEPQDTIRVELEAKRAVRKLGENALRTFYTLRATHVEGGLVMECLPQNVLEVLRRSKVSAGEGDDEPETLVMRINDEPIDEHEFDGYEDMTFRHVRSLEYALNGRGTVINSIRSDVYEDDDEGGVDIIGTQVIQAGSMKEEEAPTLTLRGWGEEVDVHNIPDLIQHPDLLKLETKNSISELHDDLSFYSIVEQYSVDKNLIRYTQAEDRRAMFAMLAFLRRRASAKDIQKLL